MSECFEGIKKTAIPEGVRRKNKWSTRLDGNANRFSAPFEFQVSCRYGKAKSESSFRTPIGTESDGKANLFAKKFVIQPATPDRIAMQT